MSSRLGAEYPIEIETISKPRAEYQTEEYMELDLPRAPAIMVGDEVVVEGSDVAEEKVVAEIRKQLGMPLLAHEPRGVLSRLFK
jgi:hypothetical protein